MMRHRGPGPEYIQGDKNQHYQMPLKHQGS